jgi:alpha-maltose-1-phosphate synthase
VKVSVGSPSRFSTFDLSIQLLNRGVLEDMYTAYPMMKVDRQLQSHTRSRPWMLLAREACSRLGLSVIAGRLNVPFMTGFDKWTAKVLRRCDVYHCLAGFGLRTHRLARERYGAVTVCDRGSTHILQQEQILQEEYQRWGLRFPGIPKAIIERELEEYQLCDVIVVPSGFAERSFADNGVPLNKVRRLPFGVDLEMFRPLPKDDSVFRVFFAGRIGLRKGIGYLLQATAQLAAKGAVEVWLAGDVEPEVRALVARRSEKVRLLGQLPRAHLKWYYSQASVFVLPSVEEGLAMVLAQAMACGVPVITTPNSGAEDIMTNGVEGFIIPPRDPEAIEDRLNRLIQDPGLRSQMASAALARANALRGWDDYGQRAISAYERLLRRWG